MSASAFVGCWLWASGALSRLRGISTGWLAGLLTVTAILCHQTGAIVLLAIGLAILGSTRLGPRWPAALVLLLLAIPPLYMTTRATGLWSGRGLVEITRSFINEERSESLRFRLVNEDAFAAHVLNIRPLLGWCGHGRNMPYVEELAQTAVPDGFWVIALGINGLIGLTAITLVYLLPGLRLWQRLPVATWVTPPLAGAGAFAILLALSMVDNLFNAMFNPIYVLVAGSLIGLKIGDVPGLQIDASAKVATADAAYRTVVFAYIRSASGPGGRRHVAAREALDNAGHRLERALWEAEESATNAAEAKIPLLELIRVDVELAAVLRAAGLEAEAGAHYLRAVGRGERLLAGVTGHVAGPVVPDNADGPPGSRWDPAQPETLASCWTHAIGVWGQLERIAPSDPEVRAYRADACNNLAWLLALDPTSSAYDPRRALELATTAVAPRARRQRPLEHPGPGPDPSLPLGSGDRGSRPRRAARRPTLSIRPLHPGNRPRPPGQPRGSLRRHQPGGCLADAPPRAGCRSPGPTGGGHRHPRTPDGRPWQIGAEGLR